MTKRIVAAVAALMMLFFSGCKSKNSDYEEPEKRIYVSSLVFDRRGEEIKIIAETISIAENTASDKYDIKTYQGKGDTAANALYDLKKDLVPTPDLSHCAALVVDGDVTEMQFEEIAEFCFLEKEIPQSVQLVVTENPEKLIDGSKESGEPTGFRIAEFLYEDIDGVKSFKNATLMSVVNDLETKNFFQLPFFELRDKECVHIGWQVHKGERVKCFLGRKEMQLLEMIRNNFSSGEVNVTASSGIQTFDLKGVKSKVQWDSASGGRLCVSVKAKSNSSNGELKEKEKAVTEEINKLISFLRRQNIDLLNIKEKIRTAYPNLKSGGVDELFESAPIEVKCSIKKEERR